jgi:hypothetical protein
VPIRLALLAVLVVTACFIDRPSQSFECATSTDCSDGRVCRSGYCVVPMCPSDCTSCDEGQRTCLVECTSGDNCGSVSCPTGWDCTISCIGDGACNDIDCDNGAKCNITCTGDNACDDIDCRDACSCDLQCIGTACNSWSCPIQGQTRCTSDGTVDSPCDSAPAGCAKC